MTMSREQVIGEYEVRLASSEKIRKELFLAWPKLSRQISLLEASDPQHPSLQKCKELLAASKKRELEMKILSLQASAQINYLKMMDGIK